MTPPRFCSFLLVVGLPLAVGCGEPRSSDLSAQRGTSGAAFGGAGGMPASSGAGGRELGPEGGTGGSGAGGTPSESGGGARSPAGTGGLSAAGTGGGAGGPGHGGTSGENGSEAGIGGVSAGASGSAGAGNGGTVAGSGGAGQAGGADGSAGARAPSCPGGPLPAPMVLSTKDVCSDFDLRYSWNEGPAWVKSQQAFFFTNFVIRSGSGGDIIKYTPGVGCETFMTDIGCNGLTESADGNLLAACHQSRSVVRIDLATKQVSTVVADYMGTMFDTPNDLVLHSNGTLYFTNANFELDGRPAGVGLAAFRLDPTGELSLIARGSCNGIALSPDEKKLYVLQLGMWDLDDDGVPSMQQSLFASGDGMAVDCGGNLYASGVIYSPEGEQVGSLDSGTNLAFGGEDGKTVLVVGRGTPIRELRMNLPGPP